MVRQRRWSNSSVCKPFSGSRRRAATPLRLEVLEDRTLLTAGLLPLQFDPSSGQLAILSETGEHTIREAVTAAGFLEVAVDGQVYSGDPMSASFTDALAYSDCTRTTQPIGQVPQQVLDSDS